MVLIKSGWKSGPAFPHKVHGHAATVLSSTEILVCGGEYADKGSPLRELFFQMESMAVTSKYVV